MVVGRRRPEGMRTAPEIKICTKKRIASPAFADERGIAMTVNILKSPLEGGQGDVRFKTSAYEDKQ
jgi:hypothetical protein